MAVDKRAFSELSERAEDYSLRAPIVINSSRVGNAKGGMGAFSEAVVRCFMEQKLPILLIRPSESTVPEAPGVVVPAFLGMTKGVSYLRPLLWLLYAKCFFPKNGAGVLGTTHHVVPGIRRQIVTVHDLRPYFLPSSIFQRIYFRHLLAPRLRQIDGVLTPSEATKSLLVRTFGLSPSKVFVVPNAVDISRFENAMIIPRPVHPFLLMVGALFSYKNAEEVIRCHDLWSDRYCLKIVTTRNSYAKYLQKLTNENRILDRVEFIFDPLDATLASLYKSASALVYPSLMEGFGLPPLEAMASGTPAVVSDIPVFREIYGDSAIFVDLGSKASWAQAFSQLEDPGLRAGYVRLGTTKVREYSLDRMRNALIEAISEVWPEVVA